MGTKQNFGSALHGITGLFKKTEAPSAVIQRGAADFTALKEPEAIGTAAVKAPEKKELRSVSSVQEPQKTETTNITKGTTITGTMVSSSNIEISGEVIGDVGGQLRIRVTGKVEGNVVGRNVEISNAVIKGDIKAAEQIYVSNQSSIVGNIEANELQFNGNLRGNISVRKGLTLQKESIIVGDIAALSIAIEKGAAIQGQVKILSEETLGEEKILAYAATSVQ